MVYKHNGKVLGFQSKRGRIIVTEVVWSVLRQNSRFLLAQRSALDYAGGAWTFPGGEINQKNTDAIATAYLKLKEKVGLEGHRFRKLFHICLDQYNIQVFLCDQWHGKLKPACEEIIGVGWFTCAEMYALDQSVAPFINDNLLYLSYLIQHYDHHPSEWKEQWRNSDENG